MFSSNTIKSLSVVKSNLTDADYTSVTNREIDAMGLTGKFANMSVAELQKTTSTADHYPNYEAEKNAMHDDTRLYGGFVLLLLVGALNYYRVVVSNLLLITRQQIATISSEVNLILANSRRQRMTRKVCLRIAKVIRAFVCSFLHAEIPSMEDFIGVSLSKVSEVLIGEENQAIEEINAAIDHSNPDENFQAGLLCFAKRIVRGLTATDSLPLNFYERVRETIVRVCAARNRQGRNEVTTEVLQDVVLWVRKELAEFGTQTIQGPTAIPNGFIDVMTVDVTAVQELHERKVRPRHR